MNSYYFTVEVTQNKKLMSVIEYTEFHKICRVVYKLKAANMVVDQFYECEITIKKCYVSSNVTVDLAYYKLNDLAEARKIILGVF